MKHLKKGDQAPNFRVKDQTGKERTLQEFAGKRLAIYFYPKDNTPGCTAQACNLSDNYPALQNMGFEILGVSADSEKKHQNFIAKYTLPFDLLADEDHSMLNAYGVWGPKKFMGKEYDGIHRTTFLIDEKGMIMEVIEKVKTKAHFEQIKELAG